MLNPSSDPPVDSRCEALTQAAVPCRRDADVVVAVDGLLHRLCGFHAKMARRSPLPLWTVPGSAAAVIPRSPVPWTAEEDAYLAANPDATPVEAARHLGRTQWVVRLRRAKLGRDERA